VPGFVISEIIVNPRSDWNGDGVVNERDRGVEVCNWTATRIDMRGEYYVNFNGLPSDPFNGTVEAGECFMVWYELSGEKFRPATTGGKVHLEGPSGVVDVFVFPGYTPEPGADACIARWPDGSDNWYWLARCTPGRSNGWFLVNPTPTATP
jgi:hypothetical protein